MRTGLALLCHAFNLLVCLHLIRSFSGYQSQPLICNDYFQTKLKMFEEESSEDNVVVRFTIPRGKSEITVSESLSFAFQVCQKFGLMIDWIPE